MLNTWELFQASPLTFSKYAMEAPQIGVNVEIREGFLEQMREECTLRNRLRVSQARKEERCPHSNVLLKAGPPCPMAQSIPSSQGSQASSRLSLLTLKTLLALPREDQGPLNPGRSGSGSSRPRILQT